jgi:hypothetical protein
MGSANNDMVTRKKRTMNSKRGKGSGKCDEAEEFNN